MIEFTATIAPISIERNLTKSLDRRLGQMIREGAREWLRAVIKSVPERDGFPVWTGAAKGTLLPLGRLLKVRVPITPDPKAPAGGVARGESEQAFEIKDDHNNGGSFIYEFQWLTSLFHYYLHEEFSEYHNIPNRPWKTMVDGDLAFQAYALRYLTNLNFDTVVEAKP